MINGKPRLIHVLRPDGDINIMQHFGALNKLKELQYEYQTILFIADLQQLYLTPLARIKYQERIENIVRDCIICGIDPSQTIVCIESQLPELAEINQLISAITPLGWLERVQNYKEIIEVLDHTELSTFGLLGLPLLYSTAILGFNVTHGLEDNKYIAYIELSREIARRFNHIYGRESDFENKAYQSINKLGDKKSDLYLKLLTKFQQEGDELAEEKAKYLLEDAHNLTFGDKNRLLAFLENKSRVYLNECKIIQTKHDLIGTDGKFMNSNHHNTINLHETEESLSDKLRQMPSDPARIRLSDPGDPELCPVWQIHKLYTPNKQKDEIKHGCTKAQIGCQECKAKLGTNILGYQKRLQEKYLDIYNDKISIKKIINENCIRAREIISDNLELLKQAMQLDY